MVGGAFDDEGGRAARVRGYDVVVRDKAGGVCSAMAVAGR
ncbi:hypothetical protein BQ8420_19730 [Nocardiopsis sp. JB363]|nr:hypothetical protein BQ8420_19730 [Nocardiopsis sp. JB363]